MKKFYWLSITFVIGMGSINAYNHPYYNPLLNKEGGERSVSGYYGTDRESIWDPQVWPSPNKGDLKNVAWYGGLAAASYLGYRAIQWWRGGPVKTARNKIEHIKKMVESELKTVRNNISHEMNIIQKKKANRETTTNPYAIISDLETIEKALDDVRIRIDRLLNPKKYQSGNIQNI